MADLFHRLRRFLWSMTGITNPYRCHACGADLTEDERTFYGNNCERCEAYSPYAQREPHDEAPAPSPATTRDQQEKQGCSD